MQVNMLGINLPGWHFGGNTAELRIYSLNSFKSGNGVYVGGSYPHDKWYKSYTCTVYGTVLEVPQVVLDSTVNSGEPTAKFYAVLIDYRQKPRDFFINFAFGVPTSLGANVHWEDLRIWAKGNVAVLPSTYLTSDQCIALINNQLATLDFAVTEVNGQIGAVVLDTDDIPEGTTNKYFTTNRAKYSVVDQLTNKIPSELLPVITQNAVKTAADQATRLAMSGLIVGDSVKQLDTDEMWNLTTLPASNAANWIRTSDTSPDWTVITNKPAFGTAALLNNNDTRFLPTGGVSGQILKKSSGLDYAGSWQDPPLEGMVITGSIPYEDDAGIDDPIDLEEGGPSGVVTSVQGMNGMVTLDTDDIPEGATSKYNKTHTGDVTGSVALTIGDGKVLNQHIVSVVASKVTEDSTHRFATDAEKTSWNAKAPLDSPVFTGNPTVPNVISGDSSTKAANTAFVATAIANLINSSPGVLDTLAEIATALGNDPNFATTMTTALAGKLAKASNLSDLSSAGAARTNLGLGALAILATVGTAQLDNDAVTFQKMQNIATDKLLGRATAGSGDVEEIALTAFGRSLIDDADAATARTTLGLGSLATLSSVNTAQLANDAVKPAKLAEYVHANTSGSGSIDASLGFSFGFDNNTSALAISNPTNCNEPSQSITLVIYNSSGVSMTVNLSTSGTNSFKFTSDVPSLDAVPAGEMIFIVAKYDAFYSKWRVIGYAKGGAV